MNVTVESFRSNKSLLEFARKLGYQVERRTDHWHLRPAWSNDELDTVCLIPINGGAPFVCRLHLWGRASRHQTAAYLIGMASSASRARK